MLPGHRRFAAAITLAAIAWTSLWPLVSSAADALASERTPLCHMAGMDVGPGEQPTPGPQGERKTHCPLCIMALYVAFAEAPSAPAFAFTTYVVAAERDGVVLESRFAFVLPPSRAPPAA